MKLAGLLSFVSGMRPSCSTAIIGLVVVNCGGCILPVPHTRVHVFGVTGQVVSAADHTPVRGASIASVDEPTEKAHCDSAGNFRLHARRGWHAAYLIGPICESILPGLDVTNPGREIRLSAPGYVTRHITVGAFPQVRDDGVTGQPVGAYLSVGQLDLSSSPEAYRRHSF